MAAAYCTQQMGDLTRGMTLRAIQASGAESALRTVRTGPLPSSHNIACNTLPYVFAWMGLPAQFRCKFFHNNPYSARFVAFVWRLFKRAPQAAAAGCSTGAILSETTPHDNVPHQAVLVMRLLRGPVGLRMILVNDR